MPGYRGLSLREPERSDVRLTRVPEGDTLYRTAAGLRPYLVGRRVTAARADRSGPGAAGPSPRRAARSRAVESLGKNLLIRFDNGLEIRTHLRMNGSWHRYRPGERWRRPPARARLVLEVPGAVAVCFDAPVVELLETARRGAPSVAVAARAGPAVDPRFDADEALRRLRDPSAAAVDDRRGADRPARARRASATSTRTRSCGSSGSRRSRRVGDARRRDPRPAGRDGPAAALANASAAGPERVHARTGDRGAPGPLYVYGRAGRPCRRCRTPIASAPTGRPTSAAHARTGARPARVPRASIPRHVRALHRPGRGAVPARRAVAVHRDGWSGSGSPGSAGARPGSATTAASASLPRPPRVPR